MKQKKKGECCSPASESETCCTVTAIVTADEKGQIVLPKEIRNQMGIKAGDKLALVSIIGKKGACCLMLMKANEFNGMVKIKIDSVLKKTEV